MYCCPSARSRQATAWWWWWFSCSVLFLPFYYGFLFAFFFYFSFFLLLFCVTVLCTLFSRTYYFKYYINNFFLYYYLMSIEIYWSKCPEREKIKRSKVNMKAYSYSFPSFRKKEQIYIYFFAALSPRTLDYYPFVAVLLVACFRGKKENAYIYIYIYMSRHSQINKSAEFMNPHLPLFGTLRPPSLFLIGGGFVKFFSQNHLLPVFFRFHFSFFRNGGREGEQKKKGGEKNGFYALSCCCCFAPSFAFTYIYFFFFFSFTGARMRIPSSTYRSYPHA